MPRDDTRAWFRRVRELRGHAEEGCVECMYRLSECFRERRKDAKGNDMQFRRWLEQSAEGGYAPAQRTLGILLHNGEDGFEEDMARAADMYKRAAAQNDERARYNLALCYMEGDGVDEDTDAALDLLEGLATAEEDNLDARCELAGLLLDMGRDRERALRLLEEGVAAGHGMSAYRLGLCYREGLGAVPVDCARGKKLLALAWDRGVEEAVRVCYCGEHAEKILNHEASFREETRAAAQERLRAERRRAARARRRRAKKKNTTKAAPEPDAADDGNDADADADETDEPATCAVCLEAMLPTDATTAKETCGHAYHAVCLDEWYAASRRRGIALITCPSCGK